MQHSSKFAYHYSPTPTTSFGDLRGCTFRIFDRLPKASLVTRRCYATICLSRLSYMCTPHSQNDIITLAWMSAVLALSTAFTPLCRVAEC